MIKMQNLPFKDHQKGGRCNDLQKYKSHELARRCVEISHLFCPAEAIKGDWTSFFKVSQNELVKEAYTVCRGCLSSITVGFALS